MATVMRIIMTLQYCVFFLIVGLVLWRMCVWAGPCNPTDGTMYGGPRRMAHCVSVWGCSEEAQIHVPCSHV